LSVLIRDVELEGQTTQVYIDGNRIAELGKKREADTVIEGKGKIALPGFVNLHTHSPMALFRGFGDDLPLQSWLETRIWPQEAKITPEDIYWGAKLACLEMIKTGTTTFNDMYFHMDQVAKAVKETGLRAVLSEGFIDLGIPSRAKEQFKAVEESNRKIEAMRNPRIVPALGPHAIYTVSEDSLLKFREIADKKGYLIHTHLSETMREVDDCVTQHGMRPAQYLDKLGFLAKDVIAAHGCWFEPSEIEVFARTGAKVAHCPTSNMKLAVGQAMPYGAMREAGVVLGLGTDGAASNNNLDMWETMKVAALLQKFAHRDPTVMPAREAFQLATLGGARALGIDGGLVQADRLADLILVDPRRAELTPRHDDVSNWVYSAHGDVVDTVICDGQVLMKGRKVRGESEILERAALAARDLIAREK
jgi:5-methylthioadenosine/S-adenosylhomocysteine deaminase